MTLQTLHLLLPSGHEQALRLVENFDMTTAMADMHGLLQSGGGITLSVRHEDGPAPLFLNPGQVVAVWLTEEEVPDSI
jgi:hypothetical protein